MNRLKIIRNNDCLFRTVKIRVNDSVFKLKRGETKEIELPEGYYDMTAKMDWVSASIRLDLSEGNKDVVIKQRIPDAYYIIGSIIGLILIILFFASKTGFIYIPLYLSIYFIPLILFTVFGRNNYFKFFVKKA